VPCVATHRTVDLVEALPILADLVPPADVFQRRPVQVLRKRTVELNKSRLWNHACVSTLISGTASVEHT